VIVSLAARLPRRELAIGLVLALGLGNAITAVADGYWDARIARPACDVRARVAVWSEVTSGSSRRVHPLFHAWDWDDPDHEASGDLL
jgi:predicted MFS family arabinose efflux permease